MRYLNEQSNLNITCLVLHDADLIPENDGNLYVCESKYAAHATSRIRSLNRPANQYTHFYEFLIGGVLLLPMELFKRVNGFSNIYWGWGGEDDDLTLRFLERRICVVRPHHAVASYIGKHH